jgi:hypothetical protein
MSTVVGYRFFTITFEQPEDHQNPGGPRFQQHLTLLHRDCAAPMVIYNSGYFVSQKSTAHELTQLTSGNQLSMEHRFFAESRANPPDWTKLDITQAAADQHDLIVAMKAIYGGKWLSTGGSKGGMTSIFHRRFYPGDVDGTVAYVAPIIYADDQVQSPTNRFMQFLQKVGPDPACRENLKTLQRTVLERRTAMKAAMTALPVRFDQVLGLDEALEFATEEMPFLFWQYGDASNCANIPPTSATDEAVFTFLDETSDVAAWSDPSLLAFLPYYHQSARELGYAIDDESYLSDVLMFPNQDLPPSYIPTGVPVPTYSDASMRDVQAWLKAEGRRVILVYGQYDPWTAGAFELGAAEDSFRFDVPQGNHRSKLLQLPEPDRSKALDVVGRWAGVMVAPPHAAYALEEPDNEFRRFPR